MRRREKEVSDQTIIGELLSSAQVCRIAMVDGAEPYVVPLNYGYEDGVIYVHSARAGRKIDILKKNPRVCFEIETTSEVIRREVACDWSTKARSIVGYGNVEFVEDPADKRHGLDVIMAHHGQKGPNYFDDGRVNAVEIMRIRIESLACKQLGVWA
ncbi:MAG: pyridoxamine 5'-phosphate oxidase family protein [Opitutales bacterium]|nr:pyridoxamine 5'-phosphate oxidase family protein [Opitutales bacterium]